MVAKKIARAKELAAREGRTFSYGIRLHVIVRETSAEAWRAADDLISKLDDETIVAAQKIFARFDSVGQERMARLHGGRRDKLEVSPNLWAGVALVRGGAGTALVGNPDEVADRMKEYMDLGIDRFILSGYPHLEECLSLRGARVPEAASQEDDGLRSRASEERGTVRRSHRQRRRVFGKGKRPPAKRGAPATAADRRYNGQRNTPQRVRDELRRASVARTVASPTRLLARLSPPRRLDRTRENIGARTF